MEEVIKQACRALCHWVSYNSIIVPDYHINEGAVMWEYAKLLRSIDRINDLQISLEKAYSQIKLDVNLNAFWGGNLDNRAADIVVSNGDIRIVFEVKKGQNLSAAQENDIHKDIDSELSKLSTFKDGIYLNNIRCFMMYVMQNSSQIEVWMGNLLDRIINDSSSDLNKMGLGVSVYCTRSISSDEGESGAYCYLLEVVPRKDDEEPRKTVN